MKINFKEYQTADKDFIWNTYIDSMKSYVEKIWGWDGDWQKNDFDEGFQMYQTKLIYSENNRIGYYQAKYDTKSIYVSMFVLIPEYRSKGLGSVILNKIQDSQETVRLS